MPLKSHYKASTPTIKEYNWRLWSATKAHFNLTKTKKYNGVVSHHAHNELLCLDTQCKPFIILFMLHRAFKCFKYITYNSGPLHGWSKLNANCKKESLSIVVIKGSRLSSALKWKAGTNIVNQ